MAWSMACTLQRSMSDDDGKAQSANGRGTLWSYSHRGAAGGGSESWCSRATSWFGTWPIEVHERGPGTNPVADGPLSGKAVEAKQRKAAG